MSESAIRTAIYNAVNGVTDVGLVYDYERFVNKWDAFEGLFKTTVGSTSQLRGWMIGYRGIPEAKAQTFVPGKSGIERIHRFHIMGFMGIDDSAATEKTFAALAETVCDALEDAAALHVKGSFPQAAPVKMGFDSLTFAGVLVHMAAIVIEVTETI